MDESAYRQIVSVTNPRHCPFEKSILTGCAACTKVEKHNIAEREIVLCDDADALADCATLHDALRRNFTFALGRIHAEQPLPHAQEMRVQCGGLMGLQIALNDNRQVDDVATLVAMARQKFGDFADFPYAQIVLSANAYRKLR